jgi:hypothetical protein
MTYEFREADEDGGASGEFAGGVRRFAIDARRALGRPESSIDELIDLHWRAWALLRQAPDEHAAGIHDWLLAARRAIADRLHHWAAEELDLRAS